MKKTDFFFTPPITLVTSDSIAIFLNYLFQYSTHKGKGTPIMEWEGQFRGQKATFLMTSVLGHVYNLDFPPSVGRNVDPRTLFSAPTEKKEANPNQHICQHLQHAAKGCHVLILWLDCDREGENIGFEVMENCEPKMVHQHEVYRARYSAITPQDVAKAMQSLGKPNKNEALSVDARREIDLKVGVAFTRYQTSTFHFRYANLDAHLISYGPCQTPTLGFCVDRYDEIQRFKSTPYFKLVAHILRQGVKTKLKWQRGKIMRDRGAVLGYQSNMNKQGASWANCIEVKTSRSKYVRPVPLNTVALMKVASSQLGLGPQHCMNIAEHLYINGWISYPRTESSAYPQHFDIRHVVEQHTKHPQWGAVAQDLLLNGMKKAKKGIDHGDHPPITPMACAVRDQDLSGNDWRVYEYITCHFLATVCHDAVVENQTIIYDIGGELFNSSGSSLVEKGFVEVMHWARPSDRFMPAVKVGDTFPVDSVIIKEGQTKPPGFITETELISLMEKHGIGTDASIPTHIENIQRNYVKLHERTRTLEPNKLGVALVHGYHRIDPELVLPKVRANIESLVSKIALGEATYENVLNSSLDIFLRKYDHFIESISKMDELFHASFSSLGDVEVNTRLKPKCGKCERFMKYIDTKPHRLYCVVCEEVYSMPKDGSIKSTGNETCCPLDGFELVVHTNRKGKATRLCPKCYNSPSFPGMKPNSNCAQCPNKECPSNLSQFIVQENCPHCDVGFLSLEPLNGRRIDCNLCTYHILLPQEANKITMGHLKCQKCKMNLIKFKYSEKHNPQSDTTLLEFEACVRCDPVMSPLCQVKGIPQPRGERPQRGGKAGTTSTRKARFNHQDEPLYALDFNISSSGEAITSVRQVEAAKDEGTVRPARGRRGRNQQPERQAPSYNTIDIMAIAMDKTKTKQSPDLFFPKEDSPANVVEGLASLQIVNPQTSSSSSQPIVEKEINESKKNVPPQAQQRQPGLGREGQKMKRGGKNQPKQTASHAKHSQQTASHAKHSQQTTNSSVKENSQQPDSIHTPPMASQSVPPSNNNSNNHHPRGQSHGGRGGGRGGGGGNRGRNHKLGSPAEPSGTIRDQPTSPGPQ